MECSDPDQASQNCPQKKKKKRNCMRFNSSPGAKIRGNKRRFLFIKKIFFIRKILGFGSGSGLYQGSAVPNSVKCLDPDPETEGSST
jgi:hypothetical protein